ncbi:MAG: hypothetical protein IKR28_10125 [Selenomonadaceae bacterium]|nr:hypothetical protein [Selenomonadaceae bacterium]
MLKIVDYDKNKSYRTLPHSRVVFHAAQEGIADGERFFHVERENGEMYDLEYVDNQTWAQASPAYSTAELFRTYCSFPPYHDYDETSRSLSFSLLEGKDRVWFEEANEYTVVLTGIFLSNTDVKIFCQDERMLWFFPASDRLKVGGSMPDKDEPGLLRVIATYFSSMFNKNYDTVDSVTCFHHVMLYQWIIKDKYKSARYLELNLPRDEGIGSILGTYTDLVNFMKITGLVVTARHGTSRYSDRLLEKYFSIKMTPMDAYSRNSVISIENFLPLLICKDFGGKRVTSFKLSTLSPTFLKQLQEYESAVLRGRKMLGVLLRGSDFFKANFEGGAAAIPAEIAITIIKKFMEEDDYEGIMLTTEDSDMLRAVREAFPGKVITVAQERYSVRDFEVAQTISELETMRRSPEEYEIYVEDTTVNYFYGIYLVSRCDTFIHSNNCCGAQLVKSFGEGIIKRSYCIAENLN